MPNPVLVIDQGTHATRAILFSAQGEKLAQAEQPVGLQRLDHERVEQDAVEILDSVHQVIQQIGPLTGQTCCALTTQRSILVAWDNVTGKPLCPALSWQDRRAQAELQTFAAQATRIKQLSGLPLSAHYGAGKLRWLLHHQPAVQQAAASGRLCLGPLASFLLWHMLEGHPYCIDASNAHRMQLLDIQTRDWSPELLSLFQIDKQLMPQIRPLQQAWGHCMDRHLPLLTVCGDQTAAFHGIGPLPDDAAAINIGTGAFLLTAVPQVIRDTPLLCGIQAQGWLLEGTVNGAGAALDWAQQHWPVSDLFHQLPHWLATESSPPVFINTVGGLGSPWWMDGGEPHFAVDEPISITRRYVAIIESIVFLLQHNLQNMQKHRLIRSLLVSGGLSRLDGLCQKLANLSGCTVQRLDSYETTARGAAWLASGQPPGWFDSPGNAHVFMPQAAPALQSRYTLFTEALHKLSH